MRRALYAILGVSLFGLAFSGTLTYRELFAHTAAACPSPGASGTILGYPACVYGFFMYLIIVGSALAGLVAGHRSRSGSQTEARPLRRDSDAVTQP
jgi:hypothetical protein